MNWHWISKPVALAIHAEQLAEHGGRVGIRDEGLLESALERPRNLSVDEAPDAADLAAAYAYGLSHNHPFIDGNKRVSFVLSATFLLLNGYHITASEMDVVKTFLQLAEGLISEKQLALWFKENME